VSSHFGFPVNAPPAGALRLRDGRHPVTLNPGQSRADLRRRPPAWLPNVKAVLTWRAPAEARSHGGRVEGDGMTYEPEIQSEKPPQCTSRRPSASASGDGKGRLTMLPQASGSDNAKRRPRLPPQPPACSHPSKGEVPRAR
jgi:hypothetical protein